MEFSGPVSEKDSGRGPRTVEEEVRVGMVDRGWFEAPGMVCARRGWGRHACGCGYVCAHVQKPPVRHVAAQSRGAAHAPAFVSPRCY